jgi:hypothetical protein
VLRDRFGLADATFAFPYGTRNLGFSGPELSAAAREAGVLCSLTTEDDLVTPDVDPFDWGRFTAEGDDTPVTLSAKLDGWYTAVRNVWRSVRRGKRTTSTAPQPNPRLHVFQPGACESTDMNRATIPFQS